MAIAVVTGTVVVITTVGVGVGVWVGVGVTVFVGDGEGVGDGVGNGVSDGVGVADSVGVGVIVVGTGVASEQVQISVFTLLPVHTISHLPSPLLYPDLHSIPDPGQPQAASSPLAVQPTSPHCI